MAERFDLSETEIVHMALSRLAKEELPADEADEKPLTVWCFPELPRRDPGPKPRPALVCDVTEREDGVAVTVAYGTSQGLRRLRKGEFAITKQANPAAYGSAGLSFDTKFGLRQSVELARTEEFFAVPHRAPHGQHPKIGGL